MKEERKLEFTVKSIDRFVNDVKKEFSWLERSDVESLFILGLPEHHKYLERDGIKISFSAAFQRRISTKALRYLDDLMYFSFNELLDHYYKKRTIIYDNTNITRYYNHLNDFSKIYQEAAKCNQN